MYPMGLFKETSKIIVFSEMNGGRLAVVVKGWPIRNEVPPMESVRREREKNAFRATQADQSDPEGSKAVVPWSVCSAVGKLMNPVSLHGGEALAWREQPPSGDDEEACGRLHSVIRDRMAAFRFDAAHSGSRPRGDYQLIKEPRYFLPSPSSSGDSLDRFA